MDIEFEYNELEHLFSGEEGLGRHLDLHQVYLEYLNIPGIVRINYLEYILVYDRFKDIKRQTKGVAYAIYIDHLMTYLKSFYTRAQPLFNLDALQVQLEIEFNTMWKEGSVPTWERPTIQANAALFCIPCTLFLTQARNNSRKKPFFTRISPARNIRRPLNPFRPKPPLTQTQSSKHHKTL